MALPGMPAAALSLGQALAVQFRGARRLDGAHFLRSPAGNLPVALCRDDSFRGGSPACFQRRKLPRLCSIRISNLFQDPVAAVIQKELRSLAPHAPFPRYARHGVYFQHAVIFLPMRHGRRWPRGPGFFRRNYFPCVNLYGLLLMADVLLLNIFGTDRGAAQTLFLLAHPFGHASSKPRTWSPAPSSSCRICFWSF